MCLRFEQTDSFVALSVFGFRCRRVLVEDTALLAASIHAFAARPSPHFRTVSGSTIGQMSSPALSAGTEERFWRGAGQVRKQMNGCDKDDRSKKEIQDRGGQQQRSHHGKPEHQDRMLLRQRDLFLPWLGQIATQRSKPSKDKSDDGNTSPSVGTSADKPDLWNDGRNRLGGRIRSRSRVLCRNRRSRR